MADCAAREREFRRVLSRQWDAYLTSFSPIVQRITWPQPPIRSPVSILQRLLVSNANNYCIRHGTRDSPGRSGEETIQRDLMRMSWVSGQQCYWAKVERGCRGGWGPGGDPYTTPATDAAAAHAGSTGATAWAIGQSRTNDNASPPHQESHQEFRLNWKN